MERTALLEDILIRLGVPTIKIELTDPQLETCYESAVEMFCVKYRQKMNEKVLLEDKAAVYWIREWTITECQLLMAQIRSHPVKPDDYLDPTAVNSATPVQQPLDFIELPKSADYRLLVDIADRKRSELKEMEYYPI